MAYLLEHPNPNAPERDNGVRFWGRPDRDGHTPRLVVIHTSQSAFDTIGPDTGAEGVAAYLSRIDRPASYHGVSDSDSAVELLPDDHVAFGTRGGFNDEALHECFAGDAYRWDELDDDQVEARLRIVAARVRRHCNRHSIPVRQLTRQQVLDDEAGICGHADTDPDRRSDPGDAFPWGRFLQLVTTPDTTPAPEPAPAPSSTPAATWQEEIIDRMDTVNLSDVDPDDSSTWVRGEDVRTLQCLLVARRHAPADTIDDDGDVDGIGGPGTKAALGAFQRATGTGKPSGGPDYIAGPKTWTALTGA